MRARLYTNVIEIWETESVPDGFGGYTNEDVKKFDKWAQKRTQGAGYKFQQYGLNDFKNPVIFRIRKGDNEINEQMFVKYNGSQFAIKGIENVNLDNREINLYCDENYGNVYADPIFDVLGDSDGDVVLFNNDALLT